MTNSSIRSSILLKDIKLDSIREALPSNVFPVSVNIRADRRFDLDFRESDVSVEEINT